MAKWPGIVSCIALAAIVFGCGGGGTKTSTTSGSTGSTTGSTNGGTTGATTGGTGGSSGLAASSWPKSYGNAGNTGFSGVFAAAGHVQWSRLDGNHPPTTGADGTLYASLVNPPRFVALNPATGNIEWTFTASNSSGQPVQFGYSAVGSDGTVYVAAYPGLYALDGKTGTKKWLYAFPNPQPGAVPPNIGPSGLIYVSDGENLAAVRSTGVAQWTTLHSKIAATPTLDAAGTLYGSSPNVLTAYSGASGTPIWAVDVPLSVYELGPANGYFGSAFSLGPTPCLIGVQGGSPIWVRETDGSNTFSYPNHIPYVPGPGAISATGILYYPSVDVGGSSMNSPTYTFKLRAYDLTIGQTHDNLWSTTLPALASTAPAVTGDGTIYVECDDGSLFALYGPTGQPKWTWKGTTMFVDPPTLGPDGTVYVVTADHVLTAIR